MEKKAEVSWIGPGLRLVGQGGQGPAIVIDHVLDKEEGRPESGPRPVELILLSLAGCMSMDVISIMRKKRQEFSDFKVNISGDRSQEHPKVYTKVHLEFVVTGEDVDPQAVERSIELSETKYCPASAMLRDSVEITTSYRIEEA
jgi:putative redox protein